jgi:glycosyltransferase involved in cell wall biosynthesis
MSPVVSIILPTFNRLEYLGPTIESVLAQTFTDTRAYLRGLEGRSRMQVLYLSHTGNPGAVRNVALSKAQGEYVAFLDSDDIWSPMKLEVQISSLRRQPHRKCSYTRFGLLDAAGNSTGSSHPSGRAAPAGWILKELLRGEAVIALSSLVVERQMLQKLGAFEEQLLMCEDDELCFRLAAESEIDAIDAALTLKRRHTQHFGDDVTAWRDRRRVFEKALSENVGSHLKPILRRQRAQMSAGLARSQAACGMRAGALGTLLLSLPHSWRYPRDWLGALFATGAPAALRALVRRCRCQQSPCKELPSP